MIKTIIQPKKITCVGIDLAWSAKNRSGMSILELDSAKKTLDLLCTLWLESDDEILKVIKKTGDRPTIVGIDAPIIAPNDPGTGRPCDREISRAFGVYEAGAYPANKEKCKRPITLSLRLKKRGFLSDPRLDIQKPKLWQIEVYPHPAQVVLFRLKKTLKYKKGKMDKKRRELRKLAKLISTELPKNTPKLRRTNILREICDFDGKVLRGRCYKEREDKLDSIICGYMAAYYWLWREERCKVFGDVRNGYIVTPNPPGR